MTASKYHKRARLDGLCSQEAEPVHQAPGLPSVRPQLACLLHHVRLPTLHQRQLLGVGLGLQPGGLLQSEGDRGRYQLLSENTPEECSTTEAAREGDGVLYSGEIFALLRFEKIFIIKDFSGKL